MFNTDDDACYNNTQGQFAEPPVTSSIRISEMITKLRSTDQVYEMTDSQGLPFEAIDRSLSLIDRSPKHPPGY